MNNVFIAALRSSKSLVVCRSVCLWVLRSLLTISFLRVKTVPPTFLLTCLETVVTAVKLVTEGRVVTVVRVVTVIIVEL